MTNSSSKRKIDTDVSLDNYASYYLKTPSGALSKDQIVDNTNSYEHSYTAIKGEMFNVGGGSIFSTETEYQLDYGSHVLYPKNDFTAWVSLWGAGGGGADPSGSNYGGGGGFTRGLVKFKANTPYTIVVGEGGHCDNASTHGGGGRGHSSGGSGGGLTGLFMNVDHNGRGDWGHTDNTPVRRDQALLVAGGGGGKGHHGSGHHGSGGGGGGWYGRSAHNVGGATQFNGGSGGYNNGSRNGSGHGFHGGHSGTNSSWLGGGGGGWYGGGGGGHTSNHHNGGSGGSGHHAMPSEGGSFPNSELSKYLVTAHTLSSASYHNFRSDKPANWLNDYAHNKARNGNHVGRGAAGNDMTHGSRHGKVVINFAPGYLKNAYNTIEQNPTPLSFNQGNTRYDRN